MESLNIISENLLTAISAAASLLSAKVSAVILPGHHKIQIDESAVKAALNENGLNAVPYGMQRVKVTK